MNVEFQNSEYNDHYPIWQTIRDCIAGEKAIKDKDRKYINGYSTQKSNLTGDYINGICTPVYLPMPNPTDQSQDNLARYSQYLQRASFVGYTGRTLNGMMGMVFKSEPKVQLPEKLSYIESDVDGTETGIVQQSEEVSRDVGSIGRAGLYVDYPVTNGQTTQQDVENGIRATIHFYSAENILDWDCTRYGAQTKVSYIKLRETICERNDEYELEEKIQYRVLKLDENQVYSVEVYDDTSGMKESFVPTDASQQTFDHIPFQFIGAQNNRPSVDDAPLQEIADVNIKHYRNSADFEESSYTVGQPTLFLSGMTEGWMEAYYENGIPFGSRAGLAGPKDCTAQILQPNANSMPQEGMKHKEDQMVALGARVVQSGGQAETAEAARIKHEADTSSLSVGVRNVNTGYTKALQDVALFMGVDPSEVSYEINTNLVDVSISAQDAEAIVRVWQAGAIDRDVLNTILIKGGIIHESKDLVEMQENINNEDQGLNLNGGSVAGSDE